MHGNIEEKQCQTNDIGSGLVIPEYRSWNRATHLHTCILQILNKENRSTLVRVSDIVSKLQFVDIQFQAISATIKSH